MPACRDCQWLLASEARCKIEDLYPSRSPIRNCIIAINLEYLDLIQPGQRVLEIGCGAWSLIAGQAAQTGYEWVGVDINSRYMGKPTIASALATVGELPFADHAFDRVVATQSMEHWEEYRIPLQKGLSEVFRVLRPGGWALINVPILLHGGPFFTCGELESIKGLFAPFSDELYLEYWRRPPSPLPAYQPYLKQYWFKLSLRGESTYVLDIRALRKETVPYYDLSRLGAWEKAWQGIRYRGLLYYATILFQLVSGRISKFIAP